MNVWNQSYMFASIFGTAVVYRTLHCWIGVISLLQENCKILLTSTAEKKNQLLITNSGVAKNCLYTNEWGTVNKSVFASR